MSKGNSQCVSGLSFYEILIPFFGEVRASMCLKRDQAESELQFDTADAQNMLGSSLATAAFVGRASPTLLL